MKKLLYITAVLVLASSAGVKAQHMSFIASFGVQQTWNVPPAVEHVVYHDYYQYDWVHAARVYDHGHWFYNVVLQRGGDFIELNIGRYGHVRTVRSFNYYPLAGHVCGAHCGYHEYYYNSFHVSCNAHHHHGHNHVIYNPRPVNYVWGHYYNYPSYRKVVHHTTVINNGPKHVKSNQYKKSEYRYRDDRHDNRYVRRDDYPDRRRGDMKEAEQIRAREYRSNGGRSSNSRSGRGRN